MSAVSMPASVHIGCEGDGRRLDHNQMTDSTRDDDVVYETKRSEMIDFSHLMASLNQTPHELPNVERLLACFSQVSFPWNDIFKKPLSPELEDVLGIPETVNTDLVNWINQEISDDTLLSDDNHPFWRNQCLIPPSSFDNLLRLKFSPTGEDKTRFVKIYSSLKRVALAGALKRKAIIQQIFTVSLRLAGEGNHVLAKEAAEMATWSLTENNNNVCWRLWYDKYKENRVASVVLLKTLLEKWNKHSVKLPLPSSSSPRPNAMSEFIQCIFTMSMILADKGDTALAREATNIAIWSLAKNFSCWARWRYICRENPDASLFILETLVNDFNVHSPKLSSSREEGMTKFIVEIFTVSLRLAGEGNPSHVAEEAAGIAIWALTQNIVGWRRWYYLYEENLEASVFLLETLLQDGKYGFSNKKKKKKKDGKYDFQKLSTLTISQTMNRFLIKNNEGITAGGANSNLYKEADKSCKVILGRLSPGICSRLRGASIIDVVLVMVLGFVLVLIGLTMFDWN